MELIPLNREFAVCRLHPETVVDTTGDFLFYAKTDNEISLVCDVRDCPSGVEKVEYGWSGLKIAGTLAFSMVGVIAGISSLLAKANISIFVVSTYNTDYIFLKVQQYKEAIQVLSAAGYTLLS